MKPWPVALIVFLFFTVWLPAAHPWDQPFSANPHDILQAAAGVPVPENSEMAVLLDDWHVHIESDGRRSTTFRRVYRIAKASAVEDWSSVEQDYQPWRENKPELRARVITADGAVHWLDPKTIADAPAAQWDSSMYSDDRTVRAPLPAVAEGAVVEYEVVQAERVPLFAAGFTREWTVGGGLPIERFHVSIDAAKDLPIETSLRLIPATDLVRSESRSGAHLELEVGRLAPPDHLEGNTPRGTLVYPVFGFSTGKSWHEVAEGYDRIVQGQLSKTDPSQLLQQLGIAESELSGSLSAVATRLTTAVHRQVRYTGVEFAQAAITPNPPNDVLTRHYGDCKDKATLLVTLLRAAGLDAHIALLRVGVHDDVDSTLPGFGVFDHAIVYVGGPQPLWIDATAESARVGTLPLGDQNRLALIIGKSSTSLVTTPGSSSKDNRVVHNVEVRLKDNGNGVITESMEAYGSFESEYRSRFGGDEHQLRQALDTSAGRALPGSNGRDQEHREPAGLSGVICGTGGTD